MSRYTLTLTDGTVESGLAVGTTEQVFRYLSEDQGGLKSLTVEDYDDMTWPSASECPMGA